MDERSWPKGFNILLPIFPLCALLDALCMYEKANQTKLLEAKYVAVKVLYNFNRRIHKWIFLCWIWYNKKVKKLWSLFSRFHCRKDRRYLLYKLMLRPTYLWRHVFRLKVWKYPFCVSKVPLCPHLPKPMHFITYLAFCAAMPTR